MAKTLDFNALKKPTLPIIMQDEQRTKIMVSTPTQGLVEQLEAAGPEFASMFDGGDVEGIKAAYDLAARLMSCNLSGILVTAEDLRDKYKLNLYDLMLFFGAYNDFLAEIESAKN